MAMSRKHYEQAAELLSRVTDEDIKTAALTLFIDFFKADNPRFDPNRFSRAVGTLGYMARYRRNPGKFPDSVAEVLYQMAGDGANEECGDSSIGRWYGLMLDITEAEFAEAAEEYDLLDAVEAEFPRLRGIGFPLHVIVSEDSQGFVDYEDFGSKKDAEEAWEEVEQECAYYEEGEG